LDEGKTFGDRCCYFAFVFLLAVRRLLLAMLRLAVLDEYMLLGNDERQTPLER